ncbi:MAG: hypothetical protein ACRD6N_05445, partial [Pyrinomonadaceae bacterium]
MVSLSGFALSPILIGVDYLINILKSFSKFSLLEVASAYYRYTVSRHKTCLCLCADHARHCSTGGLYFVRLKWTGSAARARIVDGTGSGLADNLKPVLYVLAIGVGKYQSGSAAVAFGST